LNAGSINAGDKVRPYIGLTCKHSFVWPGLKDYTDRPVDY